MLDPWASLGVLYLGLGGLAAPLERLGLAPRITLSRALSGTYLERGSVHACTLLYTRGYTMVYTRVYFSPPR